MYEYGHWQYTRAEDAVEKSVNLKLPNNVTQRPTVSSMAAEAKPGWSSAPWRPKKEIRVPVVGRRPLRHDKKLNEGAMGAPRERSPSRVMR